jgi:hypothetical protein
VSEDKKDEAFLQRWSRRKHEEKRAPAAVEEKPLPQLPPVDKLTPESDYSGFMHPKVEDALRRVALKKLFSGDPHFNLPDPFEAYSGDWTVGEPIPQEMLATLNQAQQLLFSDKKKEEERDPEKNESKLAQDAPPEGGSKADEPGKQNA